MGYVYIGSVKHVLSFILTKLYPGRSDGHDSRKRLQAVWFFQRATYGPIPSWVIADASFLFLHSSPWSSGYSAPRRDQPIVGEAAKHARSGFYKN